jgi:hypothetical protein
MAAEKKSGGTLVVELAVLWRTIFGVDLPWTSPLEVGNRQMVPM